MLRADWLTDTDEMSQTRPAVGHHPVLVQRRVSGVLVKPLKSSSHPVSVSVGLFVTSRFFASSACMTEFWWFWLFWWLSWSHLVRNDCSIRISVNMNVRSVWGLHRSDSCLSPEVKRDDQRLTSSPRRARPLFYSLFITLFILSDQRRSRISRAMRVCHVRSLKTRRHLNNRSLRPGTVPVLDQTKEPSVGASPCSEMAGGSQ